MRDMFRFMRIEVILHRARDDARVVLDYVHDFLGLSLHFVCACFQGSEIEDARNILDVCYVLWARTVTGNQLPRVLEMPPQLIQCALPQQRKNQVRHILPPDELGELCPPKLGFESAVYDFRPLFVGAQSFYNKFPPKKAVGESKVLVGGGQAHGQ